MSKIAITLNNISKRYRVFSKHKYRVLGALGLPMPKKACNDFWALRNINLEIKEGAKLGIVGRNGAGKSTLLKIAAGQIKPTEGLVKTNGNVQALMELGTGFHPEFSGWENILSALSYMGITGKEAKKQAAEIMEFAELEEFIHNPLRTYSSGMYTRLAFSVATNIKPKILIIDEILGAGDAYFANKAYERMKEITSSGATILFVSHDMSAVERLCDEAIWLERGIIEMKDATLEVSKAYADMIRKREEARLSAKNSMMQHCGLSSKKKLDVNSILQVLIRILAYSGKVEVSQVNLEIDNNVYSSLKVGGAQDCEISENSFVSMDKTMAQWSKPHCDSTGASWRQLDNNKSGVVVFNLSGINLKSKYKLTLRSRGGSFEVQCYNGKDYQSIAKFDGCLDWTVFSLELSSNILQNFLEKSGYTTNFSQQSEDRANHTQKNKNLNIVKKDEIFTGDVFLEEVIIHSGDYKQKNIFNSFDPFFVTIKYSILRDIEHLEIVLSIYHKGMNIMQLLSNVINTDLSVHGVREITLQIAELPLGRGTYNMTVGVFPSIDMNALNNEKTAYVLQDRYYEFKVEQPERGVVSFGLVRAHANWEIS
jgi:lipopolysaccharide transport system ATP-binding protein